MVLYWYWYYEAYWSVISQIIKLSCDCHVNDLSRDWLIEISCEWNHDFSILYRPEQGPSFNNKWQCTKVHVHVCSHSRQPQNYDVISIVLVWLWQLLLVIDL